MCGEVAASGRLSGSEHWDGKEEPCGRIDQSGPTLGGEKEEKNHRASNRHSRKKDRYAVKAARAAVLRQNDKVRFFVVKPVISENTLNSLRCFAGIRSNSLLMPLRGSVVTSRTISDVQVPG